MGLVAVVAGLVVVSGGEEADPRTPPALPGLAAPFLGTAVVGSGGLTAAVDAYGSVVDLRAGPGRPALIDNPAARQAAGTVAADTGIVPRVRVGGGPAVPFWRADSVRQRYLDGTNVVRTVATVGAATAIVTTAAVGSSLAVRMAAKGAGAQPVVGVAVEDGVECRQARLPGRLELVCRAARAAPDAVDAERLLRQAARGDRRWLRRARPLAGGAPGWAMAMYQRSLLILRALTDGDTGAAVAGARDGWAYVWPRDAGTVALAFTAAGYEKAARRVARFLAGLDLDAAARFGGAGIPAPGRDGQGDAAGWAAIAARATGVTAPSLPCAERLGAAARRRAPASSRCSARWRDRADYWEGGPGDYLGNAIASGAPAALLEREFETSGGLARESGDAGSGLDSAAAWAVRPFALEPLYPRARAALHRLAAWRSSPFGITPGEGWDGSDPWSAPTAWSTWSLAALARQAVPPRVAAPDRRAALGLLTALRRSATPAGALPERVDARSGIPRSTTPLAWSHAFAVLALRELWPER